jgi:hypothetical protein
MRRAGERGIGVAGEDGRREGKGRGGGGRGEQIQLLVLELERV